MPDSPVHVADADFRRPEPPKIDLADMLLSDLAEARISGEDPVDVILKRAGVKFPTPYLRFVIARAALSERDKRSVAARRRLKAMPASADYERAKQHFKALARTHNTAMSLYDEWRVDGKRLGDLRRSDLEKAVTAAASRSLGFAQNARFYAALRDRLGESTAPLRDVVLEADALLIRDEVFR